MTIAIITHPECELHITGPGHPERPARVQAIDEALRQATFAQPTQFYNAPSVLLEQLIATHDKKYVNLIYSIAPKEGVVSIDADTVMTPGTLKAALFAAGSVPYAADLVMKEEAKVAFCNVRPPGHHAEHGRAMGFCFFNNVAIGVNHVMQTHGISRVAIIDFDVHHGNGTQDIFQHNENVLLCSSFEYPQYPGYDPAMNNDHILNLPLSTGTGGERYREAVMENWLDKIDAFKPEFIFFSAGFDAHRNDPLAGLQFEAEDYEWITKEMKKLADKHARGRMVSVLEGGYDLAALKECVPVHVGAMV